MTVDKYVYVPESESYPSIAWIVANRYDIFVDDINEMFRILKQDFPSVSTEFVRVVGLGGDRYRGLISLEYTMLKSDHIPFGYTKTNRLEPTN
jgi:hypothetical protein